MRIMHLIGGGDVGGARTHIMSLVGELSKDNDVRLISFRKGDFARDAREAGIDTVVINTRVFISDVIKLFREVERFSPDIVHCHGAKANMMGVLVKARFHKTVVSTVHSDYKLDYLHSPIRQHTFGVINAWALRRVDYRITVADSLRRVLIERGFNPEKIFTMYNGIVFPEKTGPFDRMEYFKKIGFDVQEGDVVAGIAARLTAVKDIKTGVRAVAKAVKSFPGIKYVIAGDGEEKDEIASLIRELGVEKNVFLLGWTNDVASLFKACDINLLTSLSEAFPYSLLEGAREECATISSNVGGVSALIDDGENGYIFEPGDAESLAGYLVKLAEDSDLRISFAKSIREKAEREFSLEGMKNRQKNIYETVLKRVDAERGKSGVLICGAYGRGNTGDEAILKSIVSEMRGIDAEMPICVMSRTPDDTRIGNEIDSIYTFNIPTFMKKARHTKLFINGGGSLIQDATSSRSLYFYLFTLYMAKKLGCRVIMYGCGIGPVARKANQKIASKVLNKYVDIITLRDDISREELLRLGVTKPEVHLAADPTMGFVPADDKQIDAYFDSQGVPKDGEYMCFCLRNWKKSDFNQTFAAAAEYAYNKYALPALFVPVELPKDADEARKVAEQVRTPYYMMESQRPIGVTIGILKRMRAIVSMRLHALVFAVGYGVPVIGVSYDIKVEGFMNYIGADSLVKLEELELSKLCRMIDEAVEKREDERVAKMAQSLKEKCAINSECARRLLKG